MRIGQEKYITPIMDYIDKPLKRKMSNKASKVIQFTAPLKKKNKTIINFQTLSFSE